MGCIYIKTSDDIIRFYDRSFRFSVINLTCLFFQSSLGLILGLATVWSHQDGAWLATHCRSSSHPAVLSVDLKMYVFTGLSKKKNLGRSPPVCDQGLYIRTESATLLLQCHRRSPPHTEEKRAFICCRAGPPPSFQQLSALT